ncbi:unnamed protein product [Mycetohabitans rhizoxinica HKI 454]|uniref:Uncharacterized protein n=1 Tax=Mycetohabitans rhizoxinica (strain DSM 19002 / CIP 109453 / HKI 454) TaxID=882378 RepID=E5AQE5_MYCRK|nr:unnamed protein product [Mycetohabitans rhizoxinica HKI 454]
MRARQRRKGESDLNQSHAPCSRRPDTAPRPIVSRRCPALAQFLRAAYAVTGRHAWHAYLSAARCGRRYC